MVRYLSDEWMEQAASALAAAEVPADAEMVVQYEVSGSGDGKRHYTLDLGGGKVTLTPGKRKDATVSFTLDYDTAVAVATGALSAQVAFMQGRMKLGGDVRTLIDGADALAAVNDALTEVQTGTEF